MTSLLLLLAGAALAGEPVAEVAVDSTRTRPEAVRRLLETQAGAPFEPAAWARDLRRLRNTAWFYDVAAEESAGDGGRVLRLSLKDKFSTIPILKYKQGGGSSLFTAGLYDVNLFGRRIEGGAQYERFNGRDGGVAWTRVPGFLGWRNRLGAEGYLHTMDLPLLTLDGAAQARIENRETKGAVWIQRELGGRWQAGAGLMAARNRLEAVEREPGDAARNAVFATAHPLDGGRTVALTAGLSWGGLDLEGHQVRGVEAGVTGEFARPELGSDFRYEKGEARLLWGALPAPRWNLAAQLRLGSKSGRELQHKFYIGGLDTARGFVDGQFRGEHMWLANLEARPTLIERPLWVLQGNLFADVSRAWDARNFAADGFEDPVLSVGAGLRIILQRVYRAVLRVDVARTLEPVERVGFSVGLQQFF